MMRGTLEKSTTAILWTSCLERFLIVTLTGSISTQSWLDIDIIVNGQVEIVVETREPQKSV